MKTSAAPFAFLLFVLFTASTVADPEIAVAIRYLRAEGVSHAQLYLFREDGKLLRQLTEEKSGQVMNPVFAPDGRTIVFKITKGNATEYWSVEPKGGHLGKLKAAPDWYIAAKNSPYFTDVANANAQAVDNTEGNFTTPDGTQKLELLSPADDPDSNYFLPGHGKHYLLHDLKTTEQLELGKVDGFLGLCQLLHRNGKTDDVFLIEPSLRVAFFGLHLNSTEGDTIFALDLVTPRLVRLSTNWATPVPLPGEAAFLTLSEPRYVPIPGSEKTANSSCIERWDSKWNKVHYGRDTASVCYGASMYRPGKAPAVVTITNPDSGI